MRDKTFVYKCTCNYCGSNYEVYHDTIEDVWICKECLNKEDIEQQKEDDFNYED